MKFTLYSRSYCHLCDDMLDALRTALNAFDVGVPYAVEVIDVDQVPELVERFDELVPVLFGQKPKAGAEPVEICHYFLDEAALRKFLA